MSTPSMNPPVEEPAPKGLSEPERIINTFVAPSKTMADIRRSASWWAPFLLTAVFSTAFFFVIEKKVTWEQVIENQIAESPKAQARMEKATPEQREQGMAVQVAIYKYGVKLGGWIFGIVAAVIVAAVLLATFNFGFGAEVKFGAALAIVMYAWLPSIVKSLLGIITLFAGSDPAGFNMKNPVATNLAYFLTSGQSPFLYGVAQMFDIVSIWIVLLLGIGFAANSKVKTSTAVATVAVWYVIVSLVGAGFAAAFS